MRRFRAARGRSAPRCCAAEARRGSPPRPARIRRTRRRLPAGMPSKTGGMICCAVGICAITDLKREKNSVQTSNAPSLVEPRDLVRRSSSALAKPMVRTERRSTCSMICSGIQAAQLLVALAADAEELDLLALGHERVGALAREPHDRRIERAAQAALGGADDAGDAPGRCRCRAAAPARSRARPPRPRCCRAPCPCARHRDAPLRPPPARGAASTPRPSAWPW